MTQVDAVSFTFGLYILLMLGLGVLAWRRTRNMADYLLGGRRLGRWTTALSAEASDMSGWLLLGLPGYAYASGFEAFWIAAGLLVGTYLNWRWMAPRLRRASVAGRDALTVPELLAGLHPGRGRAIRLVSAVFILFFFAIYTASGLVAGGKLFTATFGWGYEAAVLGSAVVILLYTLIGGFLAVAWTDVIQGLMMGLALVIVPGVILIEQGGWTEGLQAMAAVEPALLNPWSDSHGKPLELVAVLSLLGWGLGYFGQPHILARFMAINDADELPASRRIAVSWVAITLVSAVLVGTLAIGYLPQTLGDGDTEKVFIYLVNAIFPPWIAGFLLAAILAAIMSTADSQLLVASSALAEDLPHALGRTRPEAHTKLWLGRLAVLLIGLAALWLALTPDNKVLDLVAYAWAGFGATFGPVLLLSLYTRVSANGALAGLLGGGITVVIWHELQGGVFVLYEIIPGFLMATALALAVSRLAPDNPSEQTP